jgi:hypothetical protein
MGEHPPLSSANLEDARPLTVTEPPSTPRNSALASHFVPHKRSTNPNSYSQDGRHQDPSFPSLIQRVRSYNPSHRPKLLSIVLELQQAVARYFLYRSKLPLPAPASLSASLSLYLPRTPVRTPLPVPIDDDPDHVASEEPSPSCPAAPSYPHRPPASRTTSVGLTATPADIRPTRQHRPPHPSQSPSTPLDMLSEVASRAHRPSSLLSLASSSSPSSRYFNTKHANTGTDLGLCNESLTLPPLRQHLEDRTPSPSTAGTSRWTSSPVATEGFEHRARYGAPETGRANSHLGPSPYAQAASTSRRLGAQGLLRNCTV